MSKTKNVVIDDQNKKNENKQQAIQYLTDLMATIQMAYYKKGMFTPLECDSNSGVCGDLRVHEDCDPGTTAISIDLYNFEGDGKPVCDGLKPCTVTYDDGSQDIGHLYCMHYDPDEEATPLVFLFSHAEYGDGSDIDLDPDSVPLATIQAITKWLESQFPDNKTTATDIIALWSDWCMGYDDENRWLDYMVKHPKGHCNRRHLQEKWDYCYEKYGNKAAMTMFWRELDRKNRDILTEYITTQWHKN